MTSRDEGHDSGTPGNKAEYPSVFTNLLPPVLGLVGIGVVACAVWAIGLNGNYSGDELLRCSAISDDPVRLACYDQLARPHDPKRGALAPVRAYPPEESK